MEEGQGDSEIKNKQRTKSIKVRKDKQEEKKKIQEMEKQKQGKQSLPMNYAPFPARKLSESRPARPSLRGARGSRPGLPMPAFPSQGQVAPSSSPHGKGGGTGHHHTWPFGISVLSSEMPKVPSGLPSVEQQTVIQTATYVAKLLPGCR